MASSSGKKHDKDDGDAYEPTTFSHNKSKVDLSTFQSIRVTRASKCKIDALFTSETISSNNVAETQRIPAAKRVKRVTTAKCKALGSSTKKIALNTGNPMVADRKRTEGKQLKRLFEPAEIRFLKSRGCKFDLRDRQVIPEKRPPLAWTSSNVKLITPVKQRSILAKAPIVIEEKQGEDEAVELDVNLVLAHISQLLTHREALGSRPQPQSTPSVWATGRQDLCETLPYYKSYHSGCYLSEGTVYSFMLDGVSQVREYIDEDVIICRAGGKLESNGKGKRTQCKDHSFRDNQPQAVLNNILHQNPLVIICGNRNTAVPVEMPQRFCVLGWYKPTHVWAEHIIGKGGRRFISVRYRFERLDRSKPAWFASEKTVLTEEQHKSIPPLEAQRCNACGKDSPCAMLLGWMCLNHACARFWRLRDGQLAPCNTVQYHPAFLRHETRWSCQEAPFDIRPGLPQLNGNFGDNLQYINTRGVVCPKCGRCNARYLFKGWKCKTRDCDWSLTPTHHAVSYQNLHHNPWDIVSDGPALTKSNSKSIVKVEVRHAHNYKVYRYTIPGIEGCVIHAKANRTVVEEIDGPDDMFKALQVEDIGLVRRTFGSEPIVKQSQSEATIKVEAAPDVAVESLEGKVGVHAEQQDIEAHTLITENDAMDGLAVDPAVGEFKTGHQDADESEPSAKEAVDTSITHTAGSIAINKDADDASGGLVSTSERLEQLPKASTSVLAAVTEFPLGNNTESTAAAIDSIVESPRKIEPTDALKQTEQHTADPPGRIEGDLHEKESESQDMHMGAISRQPEHQKDIEEVEESHVESSQATVVREYGDQDNAEEMDDWRMQSFSMNFGMPYKFVAGGDSQSFDDSPWPIRTCRARLNWALKTF